ncbi:MAG: hypothetical protein JNJ61_16870 [Anaerolineae bacterium]|nr:hypothetical protein [Anaerolineae bacterium]
MDTFRIKTHVGSDGILKFELPIGTANVDCEVVINIQPNMSREEWLAFIEETAGSLADDPIQRWPQGEHELRDEIQ